MEARIGQFLDYLQVKNEYDQTLYGHLAQIIAKLLDDRPADAVQSMAQISREIKASAGARAATQESGQLLTDDEWKYVDELLALLGDDVHAIERDPDLPITQDFMQLNTILNQLGRGIPEDQAQLLQQRILEFAKDNKKSVKEINFFGIFTTTSDKNYYVIETLPTEEREQMISADGREQVSAIPADFKNHKLPKIPFPSKQQLKELKKLKKNEKQGFVSSNFDPEKLGFDFQTLHPPTNLVFQQKYRLGDFTHREGVNRYVYYVIQALSGVQTWKRLPDAEARQLTASRYVTNCKLSGDLAAPINAAQLPVFPGVEAAYLRCLIARIKHSSQLAPADVLNFDEPDGGDEEEDEEGKKLPPKYVTTCDQDPNSGGPERCGKIDKNFAKKHFVVWPRTQEAESLEYEGLINLDRWSHCCPVLSHNGVVILRDEEEEPEAAEEEEQEDEGGEGDGEGEEAQEGEGEAEGDGEAAEGENPEEKDEPEPKIVPAKKRLEKLFKESDQARLLAESAAAVKAIAKQKAVFRAPAAHFQLTRDTWQEPKKENKGIYCVDRFFGTEQAPVDINCKQLELPEKEQKYWDKQNENEEKAKAIDEAFAEGDAYDEEKELNRDDKPGQTADGDKPVIVHNIDQAQISVQVEGEGVVTLPAYRTIFSKQLGKKSPIVQESTRWAGFMNVAYMAPRKLIAQSIYIGSGIKTQQHNTFDQIRACLPPPMCAFPADLQEEIDPHFEIEKECRERLVDMERKDAAKLEAWRKRVEEKRKQREEERKQREALAAQEEGEEKEGGEGEQPAAE